MDDDTRVRDRGDDLRSDRVDRIVVTYMVAASLWIAVTGFVSAWFADRTEVSVTSLEVAKGLAFVLVTSLVLRVALQRWARRLQAAARQEHEAAARLQEAADLRSAFLNGVSHELRTPLTAIVGYGDTIHRMCEREEFEEVVSISSRIVVNADRLQRLVLDLLDADALLRGMTRPRLRRTDVAALVHRTVEAADLGGRVALEGDHLEADLDVPKFERVVGLLLDNARRHTSQAAAIAVRWECRDDDLLLVVEDDGPGLPPELLDRVFEPFVQGRTAAHGPNPGTGIGLTLVDQYVQLHGGRVDVENRVEGGVRVTVRLPVMRAVREVEGAGHPAGHRPMAPSPVGTSGRGE